jgi:hypothetical protein
MPATAAARLPTLRLPASSGSSTLTSHHEHRCAPRPQVWKDPRYNALPERTRRQLFNEFTSQLRGVAAAEAAAVAAAKAAAEAAVQAAIAAAQPPPPPAPEPTPAAASNGHGSYSPADTTATLLTTSSSYDDSDPFLAGGRLDDDDDDEALEPGFAVLMGSPEPEDLARLRAEQAKLRSQYLRMEAQLRQMEARLVSQQGLAQSVDMDGSDDSSSGLGGAQGDSLSAMMARAGSPGSVDELPDGAVVYRFTGADDEEEDGTVVLQVDGSTAGGERG